MRGRRPLWTARTVSVLALCLFTMAAAGLFALSATRLAPGAPLAVCGVIRPQFFDVLAPGHGPPVAGRTSGSYYRGSTCQVTNADTMFLSLELRHVGRGPAGSPVVQTSFTLRQSLTLLRSPLGPPVAIALGDEAGYRVIRNDERVEVWLSARVGTYLFLGAYAGPGMTVDSAHDALQSLAEEVLSQI